MRLMKVIDSNQRQTVEYIDKIGVRFGSYLSYYPNNKKDFEGCFLQNAQYGIWKAYNHNSTRDFIDIRKNGFMNGIRIWFCYEKQT